MTKFRFMQPGGCPEGWSTGPWDDDWEFEGCYTRGGDLRAPTELEHSGRIIEKRSVLK